MKTVLEFLPHEKSASHLTPELAQALQGHLKNSELGDLSLSPAAEGLRVLFARGQAFGPQLIEFAKKQAVLHATPKDLSEFLKSLFVSAPSCNTHLALIYGDTKTATRLFRQAVRDDVELLIVQLKDDASPELMKLMNITAEMSQTVVLINSQPD